MSGLKSYLARSQPEPLTIRITSSFNSTDADANIESSLMTTLLDKSSRWGSIHMDLNCLRGVCDQLRKWPPLYALKHLWIASTNRHCPEEGEDLRVIENLADIEAPHLQSANIPYFIYGISNIGFHWKNLQVLHLWQFDSVELARVLKLCRHSLRELYLDTGNNTGRHNSFFSPPLSLRNLRILQIQGYFDDDHGVSIDIMDNLTAPELEVLRVSGLWGSHLRAFVNFLDREGACEELKVFKLDLSAEALNVGPCSNVVLEDVLQNIPTGITDLTICEYALRNPARPGKVTDPVFIVPELFAGIADIHEDGNYESLPSLKRLTLHVIHKQQAMAVLRKLPATRCSKGVSNLENIFVTYIEADANDADLKRLIKQKKWHNIAVTVCSRWLV